MPNRDVDGLGLSSHAACKTPHLDLRIISCEAVTIPGSADFWCWVSDLSFTQQIGYFFFFPFGLCNCPLVCTAWEQFPFLKKKLIVPFKWHITLQTSAAVKHSHQGCLGTAGPTPELYGWVPRGSWSALKLRNCIFCVFVFSVFTWNGPAGMSSHGPMWLRMAMNMDGPTQNHKLKLRSVCMCVIFFLH